MGATPGHGPAAAGGGPRHQVATTLDALAAEVSALRRRVEATEAVLGVQALKARYAELVDQRYSGGRVIDGGSLARRRRHRRALRRGRSGTEAPVWAATKGGPRSPTSFASPH